jgi:lysophospholipase L1-like esterase
LIGCSSPVKLPVLEQDDVVLAFGDSITFGTGAKPHESYPARLETIIGRKVINEGVPGEVTAQGLARLAGLLERERPALMILCHGGNDQLRKLKLEQSAENLRQMIRLARNNNVSVVLIAVPAPGLFVSPATLYRDIAREYAVPLEENTLSDILANHSFKSDLIHPNAAGYQRLAEAVALLLKKHGAI